MKKQYIVPNAVRIVAAEQLMGGAGLNVPISGDTTPEESDAKYYYDWEEEEEDPEIFGLNFDWD